MVFSDTVNDLGILQQTRKMMRVEAVQWPTANVVNSANNWLDFVVSYALANDKFLQFDDTNHTELNESLSDLTINVTDYTFLLDEQSNPITTLLGISRLDNGKYIPLTPVDRSSVDMGTFAQVSGTPTQYDKIADNIVRLDRIPPATVTNGLKYYFQRVGSYFTASDTTKQPGVNPALHRGFVVAAAYDGALTLGLQSLQALSVERQFEIKKMQDYFGTRNNDQVSRIVPAYHNNK